MKKPDKRTVISVLLIAMLVFSVGFFIFARPTTSWFTDNEILSEGYSFDQLDYTMPATELSLANFPASVRLADYLSPNATLDDINTFEYGCKFYVLKDISNSGDTPMSFKVDVFDHGETTKDYLQDGLRYFVFFYEDNDNDKEDVSSTQQYVSDVWIDTAATVAGGDNADSRVISDNNGGFFRLDLRSRMTSVLGNDSSANALEAANRRSASLSSGDSINICVAFWYEYDNAFGTPDETSYRSTTDNVDVILTPIQGEHYPPTEATEESTD